MALDGPGPWVLVEQGPDQRGLGDVGHDAGGQPAIGRRVGQVPVKAGAVVAVDHEDTPPEERRGVDRGPHRQVPALGVAAQTELAGIFRRHAHQVVQCQPLRGNGGGVAHGEALLPPGQGIVGPPEGQEEGAVRQTVGQGCKLRVLVCHRLHAPQGQGAEAGAAGCLHDQLRGVGGHEQARVIPTRLLSQLFHGLGKGQPHTALHPRQHPLEGVVGAQGEDQVIHRTKGGGPKRQPAPAAEIGQTIFKRHIHLLLMVHGFPR